MNTEYQIKKQYKKLLKEYDSRPWANTGTGFDRFLQIKYELAVNSGNIEFANLIIDVQIMYENDFY